MEMIVGEYIDYSDYPPREENIFGVSEKTLGDSGLSVQVILLGTTA